MKRIFAATVIMGLFIAGLGSALPPAGIEANGSGQIRLRGSGPGGLLTFGANCAGPIGPGTICREVLRVANSGNGNSELRYWISAWSDTTTAGVQDGCFLVGLQQSNAGSPSPEAASIGPLQGGVLGAAESESWTLTATVASDNACQGASADIVISVLATGEDVPVDAGPLQPDDPDTGSSPQPVHPRDVAEAFPGAQNVVVGTPPPPPALPGAVVEAVPGPRGEPSIRALPATGSGGGERTLNGEDPVLVLGVLTFTAGLTILIARTRKHRQEQE